MEIGRYLDFHNQSLSGSDFVCRLNARTDALEVTNNIDCLGTVSRVQHHCQAFITAGPVTLAPSLSLVVLPANGTQNVRGTNPYNTTTRRFTAPSAGMYMFAVHWDAFTSAALNTQIRKNGVIDAYAMGGQLTHVLYLTTSDYVEVYVRHADSVRCNINVDSYSTFVTCTLL